MQKRQTFYEILEEVSKLRLKKSRVELLRKYGSDELKFLLNVTFHPKIKWMLPPGTPPFTPTKEERSVTVMRLRQEIKRLPNYLNVGPYPKMTPLKRESMFLRMLETLHPSDATLVCAMKDGKLPFDNLDRKIIEEAFPDLADKWKREDPANQSKVG